MTIRRRAAVFLVCSLMGTLLLCGADKTPRVLNGIDVLRGQNFAPLSGKRVGLVTNQTGVSADGTTTIDLLFRSDACKLVALFSPEHGIRGNVDDTVDSSVDVATGLPIYSLYGKTRRPTAEMLGKIDVLVFDIQDIGARFYTYGTTMAYCMEAAAKANMPFYVLDRPNPIGGVRVEGPMLDADKTSFEGYIPMPVRHGMTMGELARYFNRENRIGAQLHVVEMKGWRRSYYFWDTGQVWINPSPNMRTMAAAILYPGVSLLDRTNVSVGRGTGRPFEMVGAPWIDPRLLAAELQVAGTPGIRCVPVFFTPNSDSNQGKQCGGVNLQITDLAELNSVQVGLTLISVLHKLYPKQFEIEKVMRFLGNSEALGKLKAGKALTEASLRSDPAFRKFLDRRRAVLIYD